MNELDKIVIPCGVRQCTATLIIETYNNTVHRNILIRNAAWRIVTPGNQPGENHFALCEKHYDRSIPRETLDEAKALVKPPTSRPQP